MTQLDHALSPVPGPVPQDPVTGHRADAPPGLVRPRPVRHRERPKWASLLLRALVPALLFGLWWWGTAAGWISAQVLVSPPDVVRTLRDLVEHDRLLHQIWVSVSLALRGAFFGAVAGLVLGAVAGLWRLGEELLDSTLQMLRTVPFLAVVPLFIVWLGIGDLPKVLLISIATVFPMYLNTYNGVRNVDRKVVEAMHVFGLRGVRLVTKVVLPLALPAIFTGLRYCLGISVLALIAAEQINSSEGLGYLIFEAQSMQHIDILIVALVIYAALGLLSDVLVRALERLAMPWHRGLATR